MSKWIKTVDSDGNKVFIDLESIVCFEPDRFDDCGEVVFNGHSIPIPKKELSPIIEYLEEKVRINENCH